MTEKKLACKKAEIQQKNEKYAKKKRLAKNNFKQKKQKSKKELKKVSKKFGLLKKKQIP
jgi:hypothetical protein